VVIRADDSYHGKQDLDYLSGVSAQSAGSTNLCMHLITIPPRARAKPHYHKHHESAIYVLSGKSGMWYGQGLKQHLMVKAGDFLYIPRNIPHLPYNPSNKIPCIAVLARTDPNEQEGVVLYNMPDPDVRSNKS
jgi:uncharacterized RmlC-like cupin family protein